MSPETPPTNSAAVAAQFSAAYAARDWATAVELIDQNWLQLVFDMSVVDEVWATINEAPAEQLLRSPKVALIGEAIRRLPADSVPVRFASDAVAVEQALANGNAYAEMEVATCAIIARRASGRVQEACDLVDQAELLVNASAATRFSPGARLAPYFHMQAGQPFLMKGDFLKAYHHFIVAWTHRNEDPTKGYVAASVAPFMSMLHQFGGDYSGFRMWEQEYQSLRDQPLIEWDTMERPYLVAKLFDASERFDLDVALPISHRLTESLRYDDIWAFSALAIVRHSINEGDAEKARRLLELATKLHTADVEHGGIRAQLVAIARIEIAVVLGRRAELEHALSSVEVTQMRAIITAYRAHFALRVGEYRRAVKLADNTLRLPDPGRAGRSAMILGALAHYGLGDMKPLHTLVGMDESEYLRRTFTMIPRELHERLRADPVVAHLVPDINPLMDVVPPQDGISLTPTELRILGSLDSPRSLTQISEALHISRNTIKTHTRSIYAKLGVSGRDEAVALAATMGLL